MDWVFELFVHSALMTTRYVVGKPSQGPDANPWKFHPRA